LRGRNPARAVRGKDGGDGFVHAQPRFERSSIGGYSTRVD
jgi:hypothetical protein